MKSFNQAYPGRPDNRVGPSYSPAAIPDCGNRVTAPQLPPTAQTRTPNATDGEVIALTETWYGTGAASWNR